MNNENTVSQAVARYVRMSPQKGRLVADLIRDRYVGEALTILRFSAKKKISAATRFRKRKGVLRMTISDWFMAGATKGCCPAQQPLVLADFRGLVGGALCSGPLGRAQFNPAVHSCLTICHCSFPCCWRAG